MWICSLSHSIAIERFLRWNYVFSDLADWIAVKFSTGFEFKDLCCLFISRNFNRSNLNGMLWELYACILHFLILKQYLPGEYAFIKKTKQKGVVVVWGTISSGNRRANTAQAGSVIAVGKTMEYILPFLITFLISSPILNLFSEMQHLTFFLHILSKDCRVSEIHFEAFYTQQ